MVNLIVEPKFTCDSIGTIEVRSLSIVTLVMIEFRLHQAGAIPLDMHPVSCVPPFEEVLGGLIRSTCIILFPGGVQQIMCSCLMVLTNGGTPVLFDYIVNFSITGMRLLNLEVTNVTKAILL